MNSYKMSIGDLFKTQDYIIEAENIEEAMEKGMYNHKMLNNSRHVSQFEIKRLYCPCPHCGTEQIEGIGCPNIACFGRSK